MRLILIKSLIFFSFKIEYIGARKERNDLKIYIFFF